MRFISASVVALFVVFLGGMVSSVFAEPRIHQSTSSPPDARFEIIQSPISAKWTFLLGRFTGQSFQLVKTDVGNAWLSVPSQDPPKPSGPMKPRYAIFTSRLAARYTFMLNADTGRTWVCRLWEA